MPEPRETIHEDLDFHVGKKVVGFYEIFNGNIPFNDLVCHYRHDPREVTTIVYEDKAEKARVLPTPELDGFRYNMIKRKMKEARDAKRMFNNGSQIGLHDWMLADEDSEHPRVELWMMPSYFFDLAGLNHCVDVPELDDGKGGKTTIRQAYIKNPISFRDVLPNNIGVNTSVISSDGQFILMNRGNVNMQYPNTVGVPAGFMSAEKDRIDGIPNPFMTAKRETTEEAGGAAVRADIRDFKLVQIGRPVTGKTGDLHAEISMTLESKTTADEILKSPRTGKYEGKLFAVPAEPRKVAPYMARPEKWVPAHWAVTALHLLRKFPEEEVVQALNEAEPLPEQ
jgi:hypothetical protein